MLATMAMTVCPSCLKSKGSVNARWVYKCKKCGQVGCWASGSLGGLLERESCLPSKCPKGGDHDKIHIGIVRD